MRHVGASSYDAFMILVDAIKKAGTDAKAIQKALLETKDYNGLTGKSAVLWRVKW